MLNVETIQAVIFDMDGLMLDTERLALSCWHQALSQHGYEVDPAIGLGMVGLNSRDSAAWLRSQLGDDFPIELINQTSNTLYIEAVSHGIPLKTGLLSLLDHLDNKQLPKAVATSTRRLYAEKKLQMTGILTRFKLLVCGDEVSAGKPAPEIFLRAAAGLGVAPEHCLVLEDSDPGVRGARAAGMQVIQIPDVRPPSEEVISFGHSILPDLHHVQRLMC